ncbi:hypothetical protein [Actinophytocola gossypii]|uniref:Uncharacterized protein n=1 Tax=Actinophytocola gossypii TaxID=2812003 RepID=A0ABT2JGS1_9PSEU|nr:hypothetical protein [Actinophytocola gossypii]MCT2587078.1 hypothetical protein [Actinophytocola gossypii]
MAREFALRRHATFEPVADGDVLVSAGYLTDDGRFVVRRQDQLSGLLGRGRLRTIAGRGDTLHVLAGTTHYQVDLASLLPGRG